MATTLSSSIKLAVAGTLSQTPALGSTGHNLSYSTSATLAAGAGLSQANLLYENTYTIAASSSTTINLTALTDAFGNSINFATVKCLMVVARTTNTNNVLVGNAANPWASWADAATDVVTVRPGGIFLIAAPDATGYVTTPTTGINLKLANSSSGTSVVCDVIVIGA